LVLKKSDPDRALALFDAAADLAASVQNFWWHGIALMEAASTRAVHGEPATAARELVAVLDHWDRVGDWSQQWLNLRYVTRFLLRQGADDDAVALHHALVAARASGLAPSTQLLPDPDEPDLLARVQWSPGQPPTEKELLLLDATGQRRTYRDRFTPEPVPESVLDELASAEVVGKVAVRYVRDPEDVAAVEVLLAHADAEQLGDPAYVAELQHWTQAESASGFGIPVTSLDPTAGAGSSLALRHFEDLSTPIVEDPPVADHPMVAALVTTGDAPLDWLIGGQAMSNLLLHATMRGVAAQPLGQVTDKIAWRRRVGDALGVVGSPQLLLRLGHPRHAVPATPRRHDVTG
jgi:hypothetical protein